MPDETGEVELPVELALGSVVDVVPVKDVEEVVNWAEARAIK